MSKMTNIYVGKENIHPDLLDACGLALSKKGSTASTASDTDTAALDMAETLASAAKSLRA